MGRILLQLLIITLKPNKNTKNLSLTKTSFFFFWKKTMPSAIVCSCLDDGISAHYHFSPFALSPRGAGLCDVVEQRAMTLAGSLVGLWLPGNAACCLLSSFTSNSNLLVWTDPSVLLWIVFYNLPLQKVNYWDGKFHMEEKCSWFVEVGNVIQSLSIFKSPGWLQPLVGSEMKLMPSICCLVAHYVMCGGGIDPVSSKYQSKSEKPPLRSVLIGLLIHCHSK